MAAPATVSPLNMHLHVPWRGVRRMVWRRLTTLDRVMAWAAQRLELVHSNHGWLCRLCLDRDEQVRCESDVYEEAVREGQVVLLSWLDLRARHDAREVNCALGPMGRRRLVHQACLHGRADSLGWLATRGFPVRPSCVPVATADYMVSAGQSGSIAVVRVLIENGWTPMYGLVAHAVRNGRLPLLQWIWEHYPMLLQKGYGPSLVKSAAQYGHLKVLRWLLAPPLEMPWVSHAVMAAAVQGQVDAVELLRANTPARCPSSIVIRGWAFLNGRPGAYAAFVARWGPLE